MEVGRIWKPQKGGTCSASRSYPAVPFPRIPEEEQAWTAASPGCSWYTQATSCRYRERKKAKEISGKRNRVGKSFLGSTRQAGWPQSKEGMEGSTPREAKFLLNPRRKLKQWMEPTPCGSLADAPQGLDLEMYLLAATYGRCPSTSLFPAQPRKKLATQANTLCPSIFFFFSNTFSK